MCKCHESPHHNTAECWDKNNEIRNNQVDVNATQSDNSMNKNE